jgi:hypothetical protein
MSEPTFQILGTPEPQEAEKLKPVQRKARARKSADSATAPARTPRPTPAKTPARTVSFTDVVDVADIDYGEPVSYRDVASKPEKTAPSEPKSGPPSLSEWQDFFGRIVVKLLVDFYLYIVLGDIMDDLTDNEMKSILLSEEDMKEVAAPLAELANKSAFMKKHGRLLVASADSFESVMTLVLWARRVNRVAKKHRPAKPSKRQQQQMRQQQMMQMAAEQQRQAQQAPTTNGYAHEDSNGFDSGAGAGIDLGSQFGIFNPGAGG